MSEGQNYVPDEQVNLKAFLPEEAEKEINKIKDKELRRQSEEPKLPSYFLFILLKTAG